MEDWSPTEADLMRNFRSQWAEEHTLVLAAHQVERWAARLAKQRGQEPPPRDRKLADLRNALEHLDEAEFQEGLAVPGDKKSQALKALPGSQLALVTGHRRAFGLIDVEELEARALGAVSAVEDELTEEAAAWWADMSSGTTPR